jgi:glycosyltransferase involved in cell wall biosynthesis
MTAPVVMLSTNLAPGGAETEVAQLAIALRGRGWDVSVVSLLSPTAFTEEFAAHGVPLHSLHMRAGVPNPLALLRLAAILRRLRPGILHAHMFHANLMARLVRLICPIPVVLSTIHSLAESSRRSASVSHRDRLYRLTARLADATVCVSAAIAARYGTSHVIFNGVDTERFRPDPAARARLRQSLGLGAEFAWLAVGRLMWKKDYPTMLRALTRQPSSTLLIAGDGPQRDELQALVQDLDVDVRFLGPRCDVPDLMRACDGLLLSSLVEGLPMVLLEASASGLPCVATDVGGVREAVLDGQTGYLAPPGDPAALAASMARLASLPYDSRARISKAARAHAVAHFDLRIAVDSWEQLYRRLAS